MTGAGPSDARPLCEEDAEHAAAVNRLLQEALGYRPNTTAAEMREWWHRADLERDSWAFEEDGGLVALAWLAVDNDAAHATGLVAPSAQGRGYGTLLRDLVEERSTALRVRAIRQDTYESDALARLLFEARGYREVRRFYEMAIELTGPPPAPVWPEGITPASFRPQDARAFHAATGEAFRDEWGFVPMPFDEWKRFRVDDTDTSLYFLAWDGDEVAGTIRCEAGVRESGFVGTLGVRPAWRGRGVGRALLLHAFGGFYERGERRVTLGVDSQNPTGATALYESVGMTVAAAAVVYERLLGSGNERTTTP